jgi:hypothetical protein
MIKDIIIIIKTKIMMLMKKIKSSNMILRHLLCVDKDVGENLTLTVYLNIKKFVKKYFKTKDRSLMFNSKES